MPAFGKHKTWSLFAVKKLLLESPAVSLMKDRRDPYDCDLYVSEPLALCLLDPVH